MIVGLELARRFRLIGHLMSFRSSSDVILFNRLPVGRSAQSPLASA